MQVERYVATQLLNFLSSRPINQQSDTRVRMGHRGCCQALQDLDQVLRPVRAQVWALLRADPDAPGLVRHQLQLPRQGVSDVSQAQADQMQRDRPLPPPQPPPLLRRKAPLPRRGCPPALDLPRRRRPRSGGGGCPSRWVACVLGHYRSQQQQQRP